MVIVGAGEAGARAATALREEGWDGPVTLVGGEVHPPYERPPLSKAALLAEAEPAATTVLDHDRAAALGIDLILGTEVTAIDRAARAVALADGRTLPYSRLLLATGARPRRLTLPGHEQVLYLRRFDDALALRPLLRPGMRLAIIGGGFIGLELAAAAAARGCAVTLVEAQPRILMRGVPAEIAAVIADRHRAAGIDLRTGLGIDRIEPGAVVLADGRRIAADAVIAGIGAVPETALAEAAGLPVDNGIAVDATLATADPAIFAAGDCAACAHPLYAGRRIRLEAWRNAQDQGALAARNMLGRGEAIAAVPWFWSDQYELTLQIAGLADEGRMTVARDLGDGAQLLFHLAADGRLVAASGVGPLGRIAREIRLAEMLIAQRAVPDPGALASPAVRLKTLLAT
ncbi:NAD(P)/FAD-dependent oxidoreductase [Mycobacterium sp. KBS0706]|uniref:NAD(P)/FAD-dependent oxidoreductase n=1 Tax=Mycobacterium sp. KBS0706 TaxID=2578109 RepID=UPI0027D2BDFA|nr:FAD-dependent oxidoreductase [Mycobacterium sp. KBS0706]